MLVLNGCGISRAGDQAEIAAFCAHVMELDLSHNKLQDWHEVLSLSPFVTFKRTMLATFYILFTVNKIQGKDPNQQ